MMTVTRLLHTPVVSNHQVTFLSLHTPSKNDGDESSHVLRISFLAAAATL